MSLATQKIRAWMEKQGMLQYQLAAKVGMYPANVSEILAGKSEPKLETIQKFLDVVPGLQAADFMDFELRHAPQAVQNQIEDAVNRAPVPLSGARAPARRGKRAKAKGARR